MATYFLDNLPLDSAVPWCVRSSHLSFLMVHDRDFDAPLVPLMRPADTSAAAIASMGLLLRVTRYFSFTCEHDQCGSLDFRHVESIDIPHRCTIKLLLNTFALKIIDAITHLAWKSSWKSLLSNRTVNNYYPSANNDTGTIYSMFSIRGFYWQPGAPLICARRLLLSESGERVRQDGTCTLLRG